MTGHERLAWIRKHQHGFLSQEDLELLEQDRSVRLEPLLVRCGCGRFTAPVQNVRHFIDIIEADGRDYVRDVSLPARR